VCVCVCTANVKLFRPVCCSCKLCQATCITAAAPTTPPAAGWRCRRRPAAAAPWAAGWPGSRLSTRWGLPWPAAPACTRPGHQRQRQSTQPAGRGQGWRSVFVEGTCVCGWGRIARPPGATASGCCMHDCASCPAAHLEARGKGVGVERQLQVPAAAAAASGAPAAAAGARYRLTGAMPRILSLQLQRHGPAAGGSLPLPEVPPPEVTPPA
jgi:hypothetical protein